MKLIAKALIEAQKEMGNALKDSTNPFFKSKYADLNSVREACIPLLNAAGIAVLQPICQVEGKSYVKTLLLHDSGESLESFTEIVYGKVGDAQAQGSGITYARRYGLQSLVCIGAEDDDGNKASEKSQSNAQSDSLQNLAAGLDDDMIQTIYDNLKDQVQQCETLAEIEDFKIKNKGAMVKLKKMSESFYKKFEIVAIAKKTSLELGEKRFNFPVDDGVDHTNEMTREDNNWK